MIHACMQFREGEFFLRTKEAYTQQCKRVMDPTIASAERQHYSVTYGINRESKIADAEGFDITEQLPEDIMHVLLEGVAPAHLGLFLKEISINNPALSVEAFNHKVKSFNYPYFESAAKPSHLIRDHINDEDLTGKQTGILKMYCS